jgi:hypothetical protein
LQSKADFYINSVLASGVLNFKGILSNIIIYIFYPLVSLKFIKSKFKLKVEYEFLILINFLVCIFMIQVGLFYRYFGYFIIFDILIFSEFAGELYASAAKRFSSNLAVFILPITFSLLIFLQIFTYFASPSGSIKEYSRYYPYSSVFDKSIDENRERLFNYYME